MMCSNKCDFLWASAESACGAFGIDSTQANLVPYPGSSRLFALQIDSEPYLLKRYQILKPEGVPALEVLLRALAGKDIIPEHRLSISGERVVEVEKYFYSLINREQTLCLDPKSDLAAAARTVAAFHKTASDVIWSSPIHSPLYIPQKKLFSVLQKYAPELLSLQESGEAVRQKIPHQLVHNDLHPGNFIKTVTGKIMLVDIESVSHNPVVGDVFFAAMRLGRMNSDSFKRFVDVYAEANPLEMWELRLGPAVLAADLVRKIGFILARAEEDDNYYLKDFDKYCDYLDWVEKSLA